VVDRIAARRAAGHLLIEDLELLGDPRGRVRVAVQAEEARVERRHVLGEQRRGVALRIDGHEQHLHPVGLVAEQLHHLGHLGERRRADVRALGEAEEHRDHLAAEVREGAGPAVVAGQLEAAREVRTGDVDVVERRFAHAATGEQRERGRHRDQRDQTPKRRGGGRRGRDHR